MDKFKDKNEQYLISYLKNTEEVCPELLDLFYPITRLAMDYLYVFDEVFDDTEENLYFEQMDIKETINLVRKFLKSMDSKYLEMFNKCLIDGTFDVFYIENLDEVPDRLDIPMSIENQKHLNLNIPINYTIQDGALLVHEYFHFTNSEKSGVRDIFTELISIYMELRYYQFLYKNGYSVDNYYKNLFFRLENTYLSSQDIAYSGSILDIYYNTQDVSFESIKFIDKFRDAYKDNIENLISFSLDKNLVDVVYDFHVDASYLLGGIIAINLLKNPEINDIKIKYINENIDKLSIKNIFNILEVNIDKYKELDDYCKEIYEKVEGVLDESISNSWSNRNR